MEPAFKVCIIVAEWCDVKVVEACRTAQIREWYLQFTINATTLLYSICGMDIKAICPAGDILKCVGMCPNGAKLCNWDVDMP